MSEEVLSGLIFLVVLSVGVIYFIYLQEEMKALLKKLQDAHDAYQSSLKRLQREKTSDARVAALEAGRYYLSVAATVNKIQWKTFKQRFGWSAPMFTEVALQNDLQSYGAEVK